MAKRINREAAYIIGGGLLYSKDIPRIGADKIAEEWRGIISRGMPVKHDGAEYFPERYEIDDRTIKVFFQSSEESFLTNGSGVYIAAYKDHYLKSWRVANDMKMSRHDVKGDARDMFPGWQNLSESKYLKATEEIHAAWLEWQTPLALRYIFECGGKKYFTIDADKLPAGRWHEAQIVLDELYCGMSAATQQAYRDATIAACNEGDLARVAVLTNEQNTRAMISAPIDSITKFASIMIFEEDENIEGYDVKFNNLKIDNWRKHLGDTFFLSLPIKNIMPFSNLSEAEMLKRLKMAEEISKSGLIQRWLEKSKSASMA